MPTPIYSMRCLVRRMRAGNLVVPRTRALQTEETLYRETAAPRVVLVVIRVCWKQFNSKATSSTRADQETADSLGDTLVCKMELLITW